MTPVIHLITDPEARRMQAGMSFSGAATRCCRESVIDLHRAGDHFTAYLDITNCPQSHGIVSKKESE